MPPEVRANKTSQRRTREGAKPIIKALGIRAYAPISIATVLNKVKIETHRREIENDKAVHLLLVRRLSPFRSRETSRSETREGREKTARA